MIRNVPGGLAVFRVGTDGRVAFVRKYDVEIDVLAHRLRVCALALPT